MKRWAWAIMIVLLIAYCLVVYGWWEEGNRNQQNYDDNVRAAQL